MAAIRRGVHPVLEAAADQILRTSMKGITKHSEKSDLLTPWKQQERYRREVYVPSGRPDASSRRGIFGRSANPARPDLNSRDGAVRPPTRGLSGLEAFMAEHAQIDDPDGAGW